MRSFKWCFVPVLLVTGSFASGQEPSAMRFQARPRGAGDWASSPGAMVVPVGGVEAVPAAPMPGAMAAQSMPGAMIGAPGNGPVYGAPMGQCDSGNCGSGNCGSACGGCERAGCLSRLKAWFCFRPLRACDKQVCYDPVPPLYQFFPCPREGYCPRLAPPTCCPPPVHLLHPVCCTRRPCVDTSCGCGGSSCGGSSCGCSSCGASSCGASACGSCSSCSGGEGFWSKLRSPFRWMSGDHCCTPSAQCFTNCGAGGCANGGCANGGCAPK